jgi:hypothetical protein
MRKNLLVSFSGGETSAFMAQWIKKHLEDKYENVIYVFANTGFENEETLEFADECDKYFELNLKWVEASVNTEHGKGTKARHTDFENAKRNFEPFEAVIQKYGIPNKNTPICTRELKERPIHDFARDWFEGEKYDLAIGIRLDEVDRMNPKAKELGIIYPLINRKMIPVTKPMVNFYWKNQPFRLELKGYQGNCVTCWKKSDKKLYQIAKENPKAFDFFKLMEYKYSRVGAEFLKDESCKDRRFFRGNRTVSDILHEAQSFNGVVKDDSDFYSFQLDMESESCEVFSGCENN